MTNKISNNHADLDILIVGAGFNGIYQLKHLRDLGYNVKLFDAGKDIGGVWHWNCYPGARVDSLGAIYQFSDPELWKDWDYSEKFPDYKELRNYFDYVDSKWDLRKDCQFNTRVVGANFSESDNTWTVETQDGRKTTTRWFLLCTGFASKPFVPEIKGKENFKGIATHTGLWPQEGIDLKGKRVGIIGTGASGVQIIQEISDTVEQLTVFQRTPNLTIPMRQTSISKDENSKLKSERYQDWFDVRETTFAGFEVDFYPKAGTDCTPEEREKIFNMLWENGAFHWWLGNFDDAISNPETNLAQYNYWRDETRKRIKDPALQELLAPTVPPHPFGAKRPCLEQRYYECFNQDNVELVDVNRNPIDQITEAGVKAGNKEFELDCLIYATGFDAVSGGLAQINITATDGRSLADHWKDGIKTHLGVASPGFPNMLFLYGPQSPSGFCNGPTCVEKQGDWFIQFFEDMTDRRVSRVEATNDAAEEWARTTQETINETLIPQSNSWVLGANIPGKKREILVYPGGLPLYLELVSQNREDGYPGFELEHEFEMSGIAEAEAMQSAQTQPRRWFSWF